jgi:hypothetical protein
MYLMSEVIQQLLVQDVRIHRKKSLLFDLMMIVFIVGFAVWVDD